VSTTDADDKSQGDLNGDNQVTILDYNLLLIDFGKTGNPGFLPADINRDGKVDLLDYNLLLKNFGLGSVRVF